MSTWSSSGAGLKYLDVGGGLGVDYDGSQTNFESSVNYTLQEYANDVVYHVQSVCDEAGVPHPTIISESGRAVVAYHSVLVFNVLGVSGQGENDVPLQLPDDAEQPLLDLLDTYQNLTVRNVLEGYHDAQPGARHGDEPVHRRLPAARSAEHGREPVLGHLPQDPAADRAAGVRARGAAKGSTRMLSRHLLLQLLAVPVDARQLGHQAVVSRDADPPA